MAKIKVDWDQRVREREQDAIRLANEARRVLAETDWYVTRAVETGKPIPDDIKAARKAARETASRSE